MRRHCEERIARRGNLPPQRANAGEGADAGIAGAMAE